MKEVNCLEKNPCVEKYYSGLTKEQRLAEIDDCLKSLNKLAKNLLDQRNELLKGWYDGDNFLNKLYSGR